MCDGCEIDKIDLFLLNQPNICMYCSWAGILPETIDNLESVVCLYPDNKLLQKTGHPKGKIYRTFLKVMQSMESCDHFDHTKKTDKRMKLLEWLGLYSSANGELRDGSVYNYGKEGLAEENDFETEKTCLWCSNAGLFFNPVDQKESAACCLFHTGRKFKKKDRPSNAECRNYLKVMEHGECCKDWTSIPDEYKERRSRLLEWLGLLNGKECCVEKRS